MQEKDRVEGAEEVEVTDGRQYTRTVEAEEDSEVIKRMGEHSMFPGDIGATQKTQNEHKNTQTEQERKRKEDMQVMYEAMKTKIRSTGDDTEQMVQEIASRVTKSIRNRRHTWKTDKNVKATIKETLTKRADRLTASMPVYKKAISADNSPEKNVEYVDTQKHMQEPEVKYSLDEDEEILRYKKATQSDTDDLK